MEKVSGLGQLFSVEPQSDSPHVCWNGMIVVAYRWGNEVAAMMEISTNKVGCVWSTGTGVLVPESESQ